MNSGSRRVAVVLAIAASVALLTACAPSPAPPPPGPTKAQLKDMMAVWAAGESTMFADQVPELLNEVTVKGFVADDEWADVMTGCVADMGVTGVLYGKGGESGGALLTQFHADQQEANYANAVCTIQYPPASLQSRLKTPQQLDYIYDYYEDSLIPCLRSSGRAVIGLPTRGSFVQGAGFGLVMWSPYDSFASQEVDATVQTEMKLLRKKCPELPEGMVR